MNTTIKMIERQAKEQANAETAKTLLEIREFIDRHKLNKSHIANAVGLRPQHINRMTSGQHVPKLDSLLLLIKGVELVFGETFEPVGFVKIRSKLVKKSRVTPETIESLDANQVFVFGSNTDGRHGGGAANYAHKRFGAEWGVAEGMTGKTYAIPTCTAFIEKIGLDLITESVNRFIDHARRTPEAEYLVTPIGCGIAGFSVEEIAPLFKDCLQIKNVCLPQSFWTILK